MSTMSKGNGQQSRKSALSIGQWYVLVSSLVAAGTIGGCVFGWSALVVALERDGMYEGLCASGSNATSSSLPPTCDARTLAFNHIFSAGFFALVGGRLVMGVLMDLLGPRACAVSGGLLVSLGAVLFALSKTLGADFYAAALFLIGLGGCGVHIANFQLANLFGESRKATVTAAYSSVFGVSGLMFTFFELLHRHGATIPALFAGFAVWSLCIAINSGILHSDRPYRLNETLTWEGLARFRWREDGVDKFQQDGKLKPTVDASAKAVSHSPTDHKTTSSANDTQTLVEQLMTSDFLAVTLFYSFVFAALQFYIGSAAKVLFAYGDTDATFVRIFNIIGSVGFLGFPFWGWVLSNGLHVGFSVCATCGIAYALLSITSSLHLQILTFVFWTAARMMLFSSYFSYLPKRFGYETFGRINGIASIIAACIGMMNTPLLSLALSVGFPAVFAGYAALFMASYFFPYNVYLWELECRANLVKDHVLLEEGRVSDVVTVVRCQRSLSSVSLEEVSV